MLDNFLLGVINKKSAQMSSTVERSGIGKSILDYISYAAAFASCACVALQAYIPAILFLLIATTLAVLPMQANGTRKKESNFKQSFFAVFVFFFMLGANQTSMATAFLILSFFVAHLAYNKDDAGTPILGYAEKIIFCIACCLAPSVYALLAILMGFGLWVDTAKAFLTSHFKNKI